LPESPRWLESVGCDAEAEAVLQAIEAEAGAHGPLPAPLPLSLPPASPQRGLAALFRPPLLVNLTVGCTCLIVINTLLYGFVTWLPTFFVSQGLSIRTSFSTSFMMSLGAPVGSAIGALLADRWGRRPMIIGASAAAVAFGLLFPLITNPGLLQITGFALTIPIYVLVALLFGIYIPELFPTEVRLRGAGICNTFGRGATIVTPFVVVMLFQAGGLTDVLRLMIGLLVLQVVVVAVFGVESARRRLEDVQPKGRDSDLPVKVGAFPFKETLDE
jgi:MFS transporter, putative metabolite:H+ symporter